MSKRGTSKEWGSETRTPRQKDLPGRGFDNRDNRGRGVEGGSVFIGERRFEDIGNQM